MKAIATVMPEQDGHRVCFLVPVAALRRGSHVTHASRQRVETRDYESVAIN